MSTDYCYSVCIYKFEFTIGDADVVNNYCQFSSF